MEKKKVAARAKAVAKECAAPEVTRGKPKFAKVGAKLHEQREAEQQVAALLVVEHAACECADLAVDVQEPKLLRGGQHGRSAEEDFAGGGRARERRVLAIELAHRCLRDRVVELQSERLG